MTEHYHPGASDLLIGCQCDNPYSPTQYAWFIGRHCKSQAYVVLVDDKTHGHLLVRSFRHPVCYPSRRMPLSLLIFGLQRGARAYGNW